MKYIYPLRIEDLRRKVESVNTHLSNLKLIVSERYGYVAIDYTFGKGISTLIAGLSRAKAFEILSSIEMILILEKGEENKERERRDPIILSPPVEPTNMGNEVGYSPPPHDF